MKTVSLNIDIDPLLCYFSIHGIKNEGSFEYDPVISFGIERFLKILEKHSIKATFFVTSSMLKAKDLEVLRRIKEEGHEIANHSFSHNYSFSLMSELEILKDVEDNHKFIESELGYECKGFRSPGYNSSKGVVTALKNMNYVYDSSLFPSFVYNLAKWLIIKKKKFAGLHSSSIINSFSDSFASTKPAFIESYITDRKKAGGLVELPVTTLLYPLGIPLIGTSINTFPKFVLDMMLKISCLKDFVNIEMHAIDMCDISDGDEFKPIEKMQFDLKVPLAQKERRLSGIIKYYTDNGFQFKTLLEVATQMLEENFDK
jgi:hypothetical protein